MWCVCACVCLSAQNVLCVVLCVRSVCGLCVCEHACLCVRGVHTTNVKCYYGGISTHNGTTSVKSIGSTLSLQHG